MAQLLAMPKLSDTMKEGVLRKWVRKVGDEISPGDVLAEVDTDKATMDFESFDKGVILKLLVKDGDTVPLGAPIAILGTAGEDISAALSQAEAMPNGESSAPDAAEARPKTATAGAAAPVPETAKTTTTPSPSPGGRLASPLARKLATELGIDLRRITGTGPGGRIIERDVKNAFASAATAPIATAVAPQPPAIPRGDQVVPLSPMRKTIARRLVESKTQVPHFYLTADCDMEAAVHLRAQVGEVHAAKLSFNHLVIKAAALALQRIPEAHASWSDEGIVRHARVDIGMAVAIDDGLLTPVIRSAEVKTLGQIAAEAQDLATRARDRKLTSEEITGSTFSVSNLGMMGIKEFSAIINPPESGILAVGAVRKEPVVKNDQIVIGQRMSLTLSCDHRVVDGALGARLLTTIISLLERPLSLVF